MVTPATGTCPPQPLHPKRILINSHWADPDILFISMKVRGQMYFIAFVGSSEVQPGLKSVGAVADLCHT